jgi:hypothetical protein
VWDTKDRPWDTVFVSIYKYWRKAPFMFTSIIYIRFSFTLLYFLVQAKFFNYFNFALFKVLPSLAWSLSSTRNTLAFLPGYRC